MKQFTQKILVFTIVPIVIGISTIISISFITSKSVNYQLDSNITELYIGDSHIQLAINDSLLDHGKNVATSAESYLFSYYKLKKLIETNPNIKKVYLGFSYHNLSSYYDEFINGENSPSISPKYFHLLPINEQLKLIYWNSKDLSTFLRSYFSITYKYILKKQSFSGSYSNNFQNTFAVDSSMEKRLKFQYYENETDNHFSKTNLLYLEKTIAFCSANNIDLYLLNAPLHPFYKSKIPDDFTNEYKKVIDVLNTKVMDLSTTPLSDSCYIPDGDHLSIKGATKFTKDFFVNQ